MLDPSFLRGYAGVTSAGPEQAWVPRVGCLLAEAGGRMGMQMSPSLDLQSLVLCVGDLNLQIQAGPPPPTLSLLLPTNAGRLCAGRALESHRLHVAWW